jgi:hypothetical protein
LRQSQHARRTPSLDVKRGVQRVLTSAHGRKRATHHVLTTVQHDRRPLDP